MSDSQTYRIAHTAQCKLKMSADAPDRNLRFILGHAFTLDKMMLRIAEIENSGSDSDSDSEEQEQEQISTPVENRRASFSRHREEELKSTSTRKRSSPSPPPVLDDGDSTDSDEEEDIGEEDDDEEEGLGLRRYESGTTTGLNVAVREVRDDDDDNNDGGGAFSDEELKSITQSEASEELGKVYNHVRSCPCHGTDCPKGEKLWELPHGGKVGVRRAVVQVEK